MQALAGPDIFLFANFHLDRRRGGLFRVRPIGKPKPTAHRRQLRGRAMSTHSIDGFNCFNEPALGITVTN